MNVKSMSNGEQFHMAKCIVVVVIYEHSILDSMHYLQAPG